MGKSCADMQKIIAHLNSIGALSEAFFTARVIPCFLCFLSAVLLGMQI